MNSLRVDMIIKRITTEKSKKEIDTSDEGRTFCRDFPVSGLAA